MHVAFAWRIQSAIRVCVPLCPLRYPRSELVWTACSVAATSALLRIWRSECSSEQPLSSGQQLSSTRSRRLSWPARLPDCERTVSAIDHCMHALDITLCLFRVARETAPDRSQVRISDITPTAAKRRWFRWGIKTHVKCHRAASWCSARVDKQCRFTAKMGNESRCFSRPWKIVLCFKLIRLSSVMTWHRFRIGNFRVWRI